MIVIWGCCCQMYCLLATLNWISFPISFLMSKTKWWRRCRWGEIQLIRTNSVNSWKHCTESGASDPFPSRAVFHRSILVLCEIYESLLARVQSRLPVFGRVCESQSSQCVGRWRWTYPVQCTGSYTQFEIDSSFNFITMQYAYCLTSQKISGIANNEIFPSHVQSTEPNPSEIKSSVPLLLFHRIESTFQDSFFRFKSVHSFFQFMIMPANSRLEISYTPREP